MKALSLALIIGLLTIGSALAQTSQPTTPAASQPAMAATSQPVSPALTAPPASPSVVEAAPVVNTECPVMRGRAVNQDISTVYQGKVVYFCCAGCVGTFNRNPERYVSLLPQFQNAE